MASRKSQKLNKEVSYDAIVFFKLTRYPKFKEHINKLRKKYGINNYDLSQSLIPQAEELNTEDKIYEHLINDPSLQKDILEILTYFNLSHGWDNAIFNYLILDEDLILNSKFKPDGISIIKNIEDGSVLIKLGKDATLQEIINKWPDIQENPNGGRKKKWEKFRRDLCIYNSYEKGASIEEIYLEIKKLFDEDLDFGVIKNAISKYKRKMKE